MLSFAELAMRYPIFNGLGFVVGDDDSGDDGRNQDRPEKRKANGRRDRDVCSKNSAEIVENPKAGIVIAFCARCVCEDVKTG